jgi:F-type H+-transporting ATPase subunit delta
LIRDRAVSHRYAAALFGAAVNADAAESILADLGSLEDLHRLDPSLQTFLEAPDVLTETKNEVLRDVLGGRVHELVVRLLQLMLQKKRIQHLPVVYGDYRELVEANLGIARARVTTAVPLAQELAEVLRARLERLTGKTVRLECRLDPAVIGGMIVVVGGSVLDGSLRHRLVEVRDHLLGARVV